MFHTHTMRRGGAAYNPASFCPPLAADGAELGRGRDAAQEVHPQVVASIPSSGGARSTQNKPKPGGFKVESTVESTVNILFPTITKFDLKPEDGGAFKAGGVEVCAAPPPPPPPPHPKVDGHHRLRPRPRLGGLCSLATVIRCKFLTSRNELCLKCT